MQKVTFHRGESGWFSAHQLRLVYGQAEFSDFIQEPFSKAAIRSQIDRKTQTFDASSRTRLSNALVSQYECVNFSEKTKNAIESLKSENTFTITTGHQLSLFTGPLYFVIKILHVIKMCEELHVEYPDYNFVPMYWMATEDHDFEEIQSCHLFNQEIRWETEQSGSVGRFDLEGLDLVREQLHGLYANHPDAEIHGVIDALEGANYAQAMRNLVHRLFGERGLLIVDGDDTELKQAFLPVLEKELRESFSESLVHETTEKLLAEGGKEQVSPRNINLFWIEKGLRSRIERSGDTLEIEGKGTLSLQELLANPLALSPNVILRPVYQEAILPNLAYIGGGGEITYWLQLKAVFDAAKIPFPLIQVRNSVVWLDRNVVSKMDKIEAKTEDIFLDEDVWKRRYVTEASGDDLDTSAVDQAWEDLSNHLSELVLGVDATKEQFLQAELARLEKQIEGLKEKTVKFSKAQHDQAMAAIAFVKSRIQPNGGLQERTVNFFQFCQDGAVQTHIQDLFDALEPFSGDLILISDDLN